ncbi:uncharacterized protein LOC119066535 [Bradysia coprophila]|uniref:uncharacterized protein LOC119066535 n=1 Tax=Bradysia coprophila TaxID=38358 RepID=UPI00187DB108|nr:uncharacterized protein LOC119066535 [Bradysia coprophila]
MSSSEDEVLECDLPEVNTNNTLHPHTTSKYMHTYRKFHQWNKSNGNRQISEEVLLEYFEDIATRSKPTTLIAMYSMLKATFRENDGIDISVFTKVNEYIKEKNAGYKSVKSKTFTSDEIYKFVLEAPDYKWLDVKVVCAFAINGAYKDLLNVMPEHVKRYDDLFLVTIPQKAAIPQYTFTLTGPFVDFIQQYIDLRPENAAPNRFFLNYHREKCTAQPIGKHQFNGMARRIADYLKLPEPERYSRYSFRRSPNIPFSANQNDGVEVQTTERIELDYKPRPLKKSSFSYIRSPVCVTHNTGANINGNHTDSGHICTFSCGQAQCALEENEQSVLHAFRVMAPPEYTITDVTPAVYPSKPACRWIVAYAPSDNTINSLNADEAFESITRTIPYNVRVDQKYIRGTTSRKSAAYVVVYGVNCRCHKEVPTEDIFSFTVSEVKCEI